MNYTLLFYEYKINQWEKKKQILKALTENHFIPSKSDRGQENIKAKEEESMIVEINNNISIKIISFKEEENGK